MATNENQDQDYGETDDLTALLHTVNVKSAGGRPPHFALERQARAEGQANAENSDNAQQQQQ